MTSSAKYAEFATILWQWYGNHKRQLPWRDLPVTNESDHAYRVLVSEIMLQQTQVSRVKIVYKNFLELFPTIQSLAAASNGAVILAWRGMGYNNRALRLRDAAGMVQDRFGGVFPKDMAELQSLPGVGHYTAAAIKNFAFNVPTPCLDTNIRRILHRAFHGPEKADGTWRVGDAVLLGDAHAVLAAAMASDAYHTPDARNWHAALMDFGSLVCTKRSPKWGICPLTKAGLMKAAYKVNITKSMKKKEPGRTVGAKFVPNRIFRGKVVEELRDEPAGLPIEEIGRRICIDWHTKDHVSWLQEIVRALQKDQLVRVQGGTVYLVA